MPRTEHAKYGFVVQELGDGRPWITREQGEDVRLSVPEHGILAIHPKPETDRGAAESIARQLNDGVEDLSFTSLRDLPLAPGT